MIARAFRETCRRFGPQAALVDGQERITYDELGARVESMAACLADRWALTPGDRVVLHLWNSHAYATVFFALMKLGVAAVLLHPRAKARELRAALQNLPVRGVVTSFDLAGVWLEASEGRVLPVVTVDELRAESATGHRTAVALEGENLIPGDQAAVMLCTSGTTGVPKRVVRSHQSLLANARNVSASLGMAAGETILSVIPFAHANGFSNGFLAPLLSGTTLCLLRQFEAATVVALVEREHIGILPGSPFVFIQLLSVGRGRLGGVKAAISSGAPLPMAIRRRCRDELELEVRQLYGSSETGTIAIEPPLATAEEGGLGRPLPGVEVTILDANHRPLPAGEVGEIAVRSPAMMSGYWEPDGLSRAGFVGDYFRMGDLGWVDPRGHLRLQGRLKRLINVAGQKVDPEEIARVIRELPEVGGCDVYGLPHPIQTEIVGATVWFRPGSALTRMALTAHCRRFLAEHKLPRHVELTDEPPASVAAKTLVVPAEGA